MFKWSLKLRKAFADFSSSSSSSSSCSLATSTNTTSHDHAREMTTTAWAVWGVGGEEEEEEERLEPWCVPTPIPNHRHWWWWRRLQPHHPLPAPPPAPPPRICRLRALPPPPHICRHHRPPQPPSIPHGWQRRWQIEWITYGMHQAVFRWLYAICVHAQCVEITRPKWAGIYIIRVRQSLIGDIVSYSNRKYRDRRLQCHTMWSSGNPHTP